MKFSPGLIVLVAACFASVEEKKRVWARQRGVSKMRELAKKAEKPVWKRYLQPHLGHANDTDIRSRHEFNATRLLEKQKLNQEERLTQTMSKKTILILCVFFFFIVVSQYGNYLRSKRTQCAMTPMPIKAVLKTNSSNRKNRAVLQVQKAKIAELYKEVDALRERHRISSSKKRSQNQQAEIEKQYRLEIIQLKKQVEALRRENCHTNTATKKLNFDAHDLETNDEVTALRDHLEILKTQLQQAGVKAIEDMVTYDEAKSRLREATKRLMAPNPTRADEQEVERWDEFIRCHPEHAAEEVRRQAEWRRQHDAGNQLAKKIVKAFVPPCILDNGTSLTSLESAGLDKIQARKVFATPALWLTRASKQRIAVFHVADLRARFHVSRLSLLELRAVYASLPDPDDFEADAKGDKRNWHASVEAKLKDMLSRANSLPPTQQYPKWMGKPAEWAHTTALKSTHEKNIDILPPPDAVLKLLPFPRDDHVLPLLKKNISPLNKQSQASSSPVRSKSMDKPVKSHSSNNASLLSAIKSRQKEITTQTKKQCHPLAANKGSNHSLLAAIQARRRSVEEKQHAGTPFSTKSKKSSRSPLGNLSANK